MCLEAEELVIAIFAILMLTLLGMLILLILVSRPLPYKRP